ncbi:N-acetyl-anhydromuranmyl-L-alanine amidase [bacterium]|nr:MAG: N-acetyl-anhydromuranmyl-L-alanine amidase [bacterium]
MWLDYIVFGLVDNGVVILGGVLGISIEAMLPQRFKMGLLLPVIACGISNSVSDWMGGMASGNWRLAFGTFIGCILAFVFLPVMLFIKKHLKKKNEKSRPA